MNPNDFIYYTQADIDFAQWLANDQRVQRFIDIIEGTEVFSTADQRVEEEIRRRTESAEVERKIALVEAYGADPFSNGDAFRFDKKFVGNDITYTVVGVKLCGKFYLTGERIGRTPYTWVDFVMVLVSGVSVEPHELINLDNTGYSHYAVDTFGPEAEKKAAPAKKTSAAKKDTPAQRRVNRF